MEILIKIFGEGKDLNVIQMSSRGVVVFFIALLLIRVSGRRSFGVKNPLDNIITISLGAVLSRAIVGVSPFIPVVVCCFVIVLLHRLFGWLVATNNRFVRVMEGDKILLFDKDRFLRDQMKRALVCEEDLMQGVRKSALTEDMDKIDKVYMERNGDISAIKKQG
ncbi:DUF421 domain-containing protein [Mucilaginibacter sp. 14171R-50]|uniref:DUF421 domain-containing protein n=1 Tax=Mucilaginibacter sp. 14171R-50 TaxID=2703789 RepID=UPI00138D705F|nr:DUF421 domain-containing protein [Mucilaginibacter sp. 14171R-50]QHS56883.1 DUF421 domain-containing protein [Mucilaginibacter sp. 14171R-50]